MKSNHGHLDSVAAFRGDLRAPLPLHPLETVLIWIISLTVCSLPWMLGGMRPWAQFIALGLSGIAFVLALIPRTYDRELVRTGNYRTRPWKRLLQWPLFWIGSVFFIYVLTQALNPAWEFVQNPNSWSMRRIDHIEWLPTGMRTPFEMTNPWHQMVIWATPFLLACAVWTGFTVRKSATLLLHAIVVNSTILALVGVFFREISPQKMLGMFDGFPDYHFSTFIYKNHAGSFFAFAVGLALTLAVHHHIRTSLNYHRSSPSGLFVFFSMILLTATLMTYSRAAILLSGVFLFGFTIICGVQVLKKDRNRIAPLVVAVFCLGLVIFVGIGSKLINSERSLDRVLALTETESPDHSVIQRKIAWQAGLEMSAEKPIVGWGAGGFRFLFPHFQISHPEILHHVYKNGSKRFAFWEHAHNDYLEFLIELGVIGFTLILMIVSVILVAFWKNLKRGRFVSVTALGSLGIVAAHAGVDFPFQNLAIIATMAVVIPSALTMGDSEPRVSGQTLN